MIQSQTPRIGGRDGEGGSMWVGPIVKPYNKADQQRKDAEGNYIMRTRPEPICNDCDSNWVTVCESTDGAIYINPYLHPVFR